MTRAILLTATLTVLALLFITTVPHHLADLLPQYPRIDINGPETLFH